MIELAGSLGRLYAVAIRLLPVEPATTDINVSGDTIESWRDVRVMLREKLGPLDHYWTLLDPSEKSEPLETALSQDLSEICEDLKQNLQLEQSETVLADIHWQWRFDCHAHWGRHAVHALGAWFGRIRQEA